MEDPIVIEHRDALIYMLCEAAELEHSIMTQYLYAAFSMKRSTDEGVTDRQLAAMERWRKVVLEVATEEMMHLALVNNLLTAIGAAPRTGRPNLPQAGRYYPAGVHLALIPFGERALRHFLFLERPEGINLADAEGLEALAEAEPLMSELDIVPRPQDFGTVGHLYRQIEEGFRNLAARHSEEWLFIGPPDAQATTKHFMWPELTPVTDLDGAIAAIETVVEQGEGPRGHWRDAHYGRFLEVLGEFREMKRAQPDFEPARPVLAAYVRRPPDAEAPCLVSDPNTARVLDVFNVAYEVLLYTMGRFFGHSVESEDQVMTLADVAVGLMVGVLKPLGELVTRLPLGPDHPGMTAGPSFEVFYRSGHLLPHRRAAWILIHERLTELGAYIDGVLGRECYPQEIVEVRATVAGLAAKLAAHVDDLPERTVATPPAWLGHDDPVS